MNKFLGTILAVVMAFALVPAAQAQGGAGFDFKTHEYVATDFSKWVGHSSTTIASGAKTITVENPWQPTAQGWGLINPYFVNNTILVASEDASVDETITITAVSCASQTSCTITATFTYAHSGRYSLRSGSYGINEAIKWAAGNGGGQVIVPQGFGGTTAMITGAVGAATVLIQDVRAGTNTVYGYNGSTYASREVISASFVDGATGSATDRVFFIANRGWTVTGCSNIFAVTAGGASKLQVTKDTGTDAPGGGTDLLTNNTNAGFDLAATANTVQVGTLTATAGALVLATGNRLAVDYANAIQSTAGNVVTCTLVATS